MSSRLRSLLHCSVDFLTHAEDAPGQSRWGTMSSSHGRLSVRIVRASRTTSCLRQPSTHRGDVRELSGGCDRTFDQAGIDDCACEARCLSLKYRTWWNGRMNLSLLNSKFPLEEGGSECGAREARVCHQNQAQPRFRSAWWQREALAAFLILGGVRRVSAGGSPRPVGHQFWGHDEAEIFD